jgi:hypothetical protein
MSLGSQVAELEAEVMALRSEVFHLRAANADVGRKLYRRGYETGYAAGERKADRVTNPERNARGWARQVMRAA